MRTYIEEHTADRLTGGEVAAVGRCPSCGNSSEFYRRPTVRLGPMIFCLCCTYGMGLETDLIAQGWTAEEGL